MELLTVPLSCNVYCALLLIVSAATIEGTPLYVLVEVFGGVDNKNGNSYISVPN